MLVSARENGGNWRKSVGFKEGMWDKGKRKVFVFWLVRKLVS